MSTSRMLVRGARLIDGEVTSILMSGGRITALGEAAEAASLPDDPDQRSKPLTLIEAEGRLVTPPMVNAHMHLDKVRTLSLAGEAALGAYTGPAMGRRHDVDRARVGGEAKLRPGVDHPERPSGALGRRAPRDVARPGVRRRRHHCRTRGHARGGSQVREEFRGLVDLQVVAFPQDGVLRDPGAAELLRGGDAARG